VSAAGEVREARRAGQQSAGCLRVIEHGQDYARRGRCLLRLTSRARSARLFRTRSRRTAGGTALSVKRWLLAGVSRGRRSTPYSTHRPVASAASAILGVTQLCCHTVMIWPVSVMTNRIATACPNQSCRCRGVSGPRCRNGPS
jgi:hypothetical protein